MGLEGLESFLVVAALLLNYVVEVLAHDELDFFGFIFGLYCHDFSDRFFPFAFAVEVSVGADGVDYVVGGGFGDGAAFDDVVEGGAEIVDADFVEAGGAGVAIEDGSVAEAEAADDGAGMAPTGVLFLDFFALGVMADGAFAGVEIEIGDCGI